MAGTIQETVIPDVAVCQIVAGPPPGFFCGMMTQSGHDIFPALTELRQRVVGTKHDIPNLAVFEIARLRHHNHISLEGPDFPFEVLRLIGLSRGREGSVAPGEQGTVKDQVALCERRPCWNYLVPRFIHHRANGH